jgi:hypothetical protein
MAAESFAAPAATSFTDPQGLAHRVAPSVEQFKGYPRGLLGGAKRLLVSAGSAGRGLGLFSTAGLAKVLRAGAVMADCADTPPQVNAGHPKAAGAVVAAPGLHGVLMGGWHRLWNGPREAVEWQAAWLKTVQRRKPFFASRRMHFLCRIREPPFGGPLPIPDHHIDPWRSALFTARPALMQSRGGVRTS